MTLFIIWQFQNPAKRYFQTHLLAERGTFFFFFGMMIVIFWKWEFQASNVASKLAKRIWFHIHL